MIDFATCGGNADRGGGCEVDPHNVLHDDVGIMKPPFNDMGSLTLAARDPIFYAHHCNLDKIWSRWNGLARAGLPPDAYENPTDPHFHSRCWTFFDENRQAVSISAGEVLNHRENLRYEYPVGATPNAPLIERYGCRIVHGDKKREPSIRVDPEVGAKLRAESDRGGRIALILEGVRIP